MLESIGYNAGLIEPAQVIKLSEKFSERKGVVGYYLAGVVSMIKGCRSKAIFLDCRKEQWILSCGWLYPFHGVLSLNGMLCMVKRTAQCQNILTNYKRIFYSVTLKAPEMRQGAGTLIDSQFRSSRNIRRNNEIIKNISHKNLIKSISRRLGVFRDLKTEEVFSVTWPRKRRIEIDPL